MSSKIYKKKQIEIIYDKRNEPVLCKKNVAFIEYQFSNTSEKFFFFSPNKQKFFERHISGKNQV